MATRKTDKSGLICMPNSSGHDAQGIAVIGLGCCYPGAENTRELWENILARRVQFRRVPETRLNLRDYYDSDPRTPDKTYVAKAAVIESVPFEWSKLRIPKRTFEAADIVHWLALDTALQALADAGYRKGMASADNAGVIVGNTLTGEQTRSQTLRLRWPYVERVANTILARHDLGVDERARLLNEMEQLYKSAFARVTEDSLVGGLANTIAGRICNYLNFRGGGYVVDGACSSSLLAVATAATALDRGELDLALAGGVDVSLDPFELVGFAKAGALAKDKMRVYDQEASGFLPGEGCGFVVLKRLSDALRDNDYIYAAIRGWGVSADGRGGMMEPSVSGQRLAIARAYRTAGYSIADINFIEGHGTGTAKGDRVELEAIGQEITRCSGNRGPSSYGITSFKSIVGHTKAAAGIGGFLKAVMAVNQRIIPPTAGCKKPSRVFEQKAKPLYPVLRGECLPQDAIIRAGISSAGFGGINCHVTIQSAGVPSEKIRPSLPAPAIMASDQETEIFVITCRTMTQLRNFVRRFREEARNISVAEMADLAALLGDRARAELPIRGVIITDSPEHLYEALGVAERELAKLNLAEGQPYSTDACAGGARLVVGKHIGQPKVGFVFRGEGLRCHGITERLVARFEWARSLQRRMLLEEGIEDREAESEKRLKQLDSDQKGLLAAIIWTQFLNRLGVRVSAIGGSGLGKVIAQCRVVTDDVAIGNSSNGASKGSSECRERGAIRSLRDCNVVINIAGDSSPAGSMEGSIGGGDLVQLAVEARPDDDRSLNVVLGELFVRGLDVDWRVLRHGRLIRPFVAPSRRQFIRNQCEHPIVRSSADDVPKRSSAEVIATELGESHASSTSRGSDSVMPTNIPELLVDAVQKLTDFDRTSISLGMRLLDDFNLDSIKAGELVADVARKLGLNGRLDPSEIANDTLSQIGERLEQLVRTSAQRSGSLESSGSDALRRYSDKTWVRQFKIEYKHEEIGVRTSRKLDSIERAVILFDGKDRGAVNELRRHLGKHGARVDIVRYSEVDRIVRGSAGVDCVVIVLPKSRGNEQATRPRLLRTIERLRSAVGLCLAGSQTRERVVVFVQYMGGRFGEDSKAVAFGSNCARSIGASLHLERPELRLRILDFDERVGSVEVAKRIVDELQTDGNFSVVGYGPEMERQVPIFEKMEPVAFAGRGIEWAKTDVVIVTGGAKGITAECALEFARSTNAQVVLVGRSRAESISDTLDRFDRESLQWEYVQCDITDARAVERMISDVQDRYGRIKGIIHGAGLNSLRRLKQGTAQEITSEMAPKVVGAANMLRALDKDPPSLVVALTSVIGVTGMEGSGWYGLGNEVLTSLLQNFANDHEGRTQVQAIAFGVWDTVGMGTKLGSLERLKNMGVSAIPVRDGVRCFRQLVERDPGKLQVITVARIAGLDTWSSPNVMPRTGLRFIEHVKYLMPGVELVARAHLNVRDDEYVLDHNWEGVLLFPLVFGLEAMAQAAAYVTETLSFESLRVIDLDLNRPVAVRLDGGTNVEIRAEVLEADRLGGPTRVKTELYCDQTNYQQPHFSCILEFGSRSGPQDQGYSSGALGRLGDAIELDPKRALYGPVLFQGKLFQCIEKIQRLGYNSSTRTGECVCQVATHRTWSLKQEGAKFEGTFLIGFPFLLDAVLQSMQAIIPENQSLPSRIQEIGFALEGFEAGGQYTISSSIEKIDDKRIIGRSVMHREGKVISTVNGCEMKILRERTDQPSANDLANPSRRDAELIESRARKLARDNRLVLPEIRCMHNSGLLNGSREERRLIQSGPIMEAVTAVLASGHDGDGEVNHDNLTIDWLDTGKPVVEGLGARQVDISVTHDGSLLMVVAGGWPQGCDITQVTDRSDDGWLALLGATKHGLMGELIRRGYDSSRAGTTLWCAAEAIEKRLATKSIEMRIVKCTRDCTIFVATGMENGERVVTFPIKLTRGETRIVALVVKVGQETEKEVYTGNKGSGLLSNAGYNPSVFGIDSSSGPQGQFVYVQRFPVTFRNSQSLSRRVYFSNYFDWIGSIREHSLFPIVRDISALAETGGWGLSTNSVRTKVVGELGGCDVVEARLWLERVSGPTSGTFDLMFDWRRVLDSGGFERVAVSTLRTTWIQITGHGQATPGKIPKFLIDFMDMMKPKNDSRNQLEVLPEGLGSMSAGELVAAFTGGSGKPLLREETFQTTLEDSNLVGNIYFANYAKWLGRTTDLFFYGLVPESFRGTGENGELLCLDCAIVHLREAMPFDRIVTRMYLEAAHKAGLDLYFEFYRSAPDGKALKLATARQRVVWVRRGGDGAALVINLPQRVIEAIARGNELKELLNRSM